MAIKGPVHEESMVDVKRYKGARDIDPNTLAGEVARRVVELMEEDYGMPVSTTMDEYRVGGGLFGSGSVSPAVAVYSKQHNNYAMFFAAFELTGAVLDVTIAKGTCISRNLIKATEGKLFADKAAAQQEENYYSSVCQALDEAIVEVCSKTKL